MPKKVVMETCVRPHVDTKPEGLAVGGYDIKGVPTIGLHIKTVLLAPGAGWSLVLKSSRYPGNPITHPASHFIPALNR